jgi:hypothetical protein
VEPSSRSCVAPVSNRSVRLLHHSSRQLTLYCVLACFVGPDANRFFDCEHKDLSISDFAGLRRLYDCCRGVFHHAVRKDDFDLDLWHKVDGVFSSTINFCVAFLTISFKRLILRAVLPQVGPMVADRGPPDFLVLSNLADMRICGEDKN